MPIDPDSFEALRISGHTKNHCKIGLSLLGDDTINTIRRKKTLEKENEEERPIVQTLSLSLNAFKNTAKRNQI